jgi:hypothetical protein
VWHCNILKVWRLAPFVYNVMYLERVKCKEL